MNEKPTSISGPVHIGSRYTDEERNFLMAMDNYKRTRCRPYPTWREVLAVIHSLGYRVVSTPTELPVVGDLPDHP